MENNAATTVAPMNPLFAFAIELHVRMLEGKTYKEAYQAVTNRGEFVAKGKEAWAKLNATGRETALGIASRRWARSSEAERGELHLRAQRGVQPEWV